MLPQRLIILDTNPESRLKLGLSDKQHLPAALHATVLNFDFAPVANFDRLRFGTVVVLLCLGLVCKAAQFITAFELPNRVLIVSKGTRSDVLK
jgi:hypothetical protein